ncbi:glycosyltransferase [Lysobacter sp. A286]
MRILIATSQFPIAGEPNRGRPILQTIRELARLATVQVVSPTAAYPAWARPRSYLFRPPQADDRIDGCDVQYAPYNALPVISRPFNGWRCGHVLDHPIKAFAPDLVLSYWLYPDAYGAMLAARRAGVPLVAGARGSDIRVRDPISRQLTRAVVGAARRLLVVSEDLGRMAVRDYGAEPGRVRAIPNGCDAALFQPADRAAARHELGLPGDAEIVLYVGRLVAEKGLRELVTSTRVLSAQRPGLQTVLVGEGPLQAELAGAIAAADPSLPLRLVGSQSPSRVARWMAAADVITLPSYSEGHPNVLVEALACGRPVVATDVGGIPEVVDGHCGVLIPTRDAAALSAALVRALEFNWDPPALARKFSRGWHQVARDTLLACEEAVAESRR